MTTGGNGVVRGDRSLTRMAWQRAPASRSCRSCTPGRCSSGGPGGSSGTPQCRRPAGSSWARRNWAPPLAPWASSPSKRSATPGTPLFLAAKSTLSPRPPLATGSAGSAFVREGPQKGGVRCPSRASALRFLAAHSCVPMHTGKKKKTVPREKERQEGQTHQLAFLLPPSLRGRVGRRGPGLAQPPRDLLLQPRRRLVVQDHDNRIARGRHWLRPTDARASPRAGASLRSTPKKKRERDFRREKCTSGNVAVRRNFSVFLFFFFLRRRRKTEKT